MSKTLSSQRVGFASTYCLALLATIELQIWQVQDTGRRKFFLTWHKICFVLTGLGGFGLGLFGGFFASGNSRFLSALSKSRCTALLMFLNGFGWLIRELPSVYYLIATYV